MSPIFSFDRGKMGKGVLKTVIIGVVILGSPIIGIVASGTPVSRYLEFPPVTQYVTKAPYSSLIFAGLAIAIFLTLFPFVYRIIRASWQPSTIEKSHRRFPWWGWLGLMVLICAWVLAWNRFEWFSILQPHTYPLIWFSFIFVLNALKFKKTGRCLMINRTKFFLWLFPLSALFWWIFEYLNRFVQNWNYHGTSYGPWNYFWLATVSFSTVLPAVLSMSDWLLSYSPINRGFARFTVIKLNRPRIIAFVVLVSTTITLFLIGIFPNYLFPLVWVSPGLIVISIQSLQGEKHVLQGITDGDWRILVSAALAALLCGFFWEMWNIHSLSKWEYSIPFVHKFQIFEMPILGYSGYLPFGLECIAVSSLLSANPTSEQRSK